MRATFDNLPIVHFVRQALMSLGIRSSRPVKAASLQDGLQDKRE